MSCLSKIFSTKELNEYQCVLLEATGSSYTTIYFEENTRFFIELWGAGGAVSVATQPGYGAYTSGYITLPYPLFLYFYIGTQGKPNNKNIGGAAGYNGGASGGTDNYNKDTGSGGSGGATDVRMASGSWNDQSSLYSRIMVAGGGASGGAYITTATGGDADLNGHRGKDSTAKGGDGGSQTNGYAFGYGQKGIDANSAGGAGGGGYCGGYTGAFGVDAGAGGGGSSYISGHQGCIARFLNGSFSKDSFHYSGLYFKKTIIISGHSMMPSRNSYANDSIGNSGNGYVRITKMNKQNLCHTIIIKYRKISVFYYIVLFSYYNKNA